MKLVMNEKVKITIGKIVPDSKEDYKFMTVRKYSKESERKMDYSEWELFRGLLSVHNIKLDVLGPNINVIQLEKIAKNITEIELFILISGNSHIHWLSTWSEKAIQLYGDKAGIGVK